MNEWKQINKNLFRDDRGYTIIPAQIPGGTIYGAYTPDCKLLDARSTRDECETLCEIDYRKLQAGDTVTVDAVR
jgi:hypothetical protein